MTNNTFNKAGNLWWLINPSEHINYPDIHLSQRVEQSIVNLLRRKISISLDDVIADIFQKYPNGLTPDIKSIPSILEKYATKSGGKWLYNSLEVENEFTNHTEIIYKLIKIGAKINYKSFVGKREQHEKINGQRLSDFSDFDSLEKLVENSISRKRIEMIDLIWILNEKIQIIIEVENSTNFTSGIQRGSNLPNNVRKLMIIPDKREKELNRISDPLFKESFEKHNWKYLLYSDVDKISRSKASIDTVNLFIKDLQ